MSKKARWEHRDTATGELVEGDGAALPTGRLVDRAGAEVDARDVVRVELPDEPDKTVFTAVGREPRIARDPKRYKPRAPNLGRATFDSARAAAREYYTENFGFFNNVRDPGDGLRDWMSNTEVDYRGRSRRLNATPVGRRILAKRGGLALEAALAYVFGQAGGRRWDAVDWDSIDNLEESIAPYLEAAYFTGQRGLEGWSPSATWRPGTMKPVVEMEPSELASYKEWEAAEELRAALVDLRSAYAKNRPCLNAEQRKIVSSRIEEWAAWANDVRRIPDYACEPTDGGYLCDYPAIAEEVRQLGDACKAANYNEDWAEKYATTDVAGFPPLSDHAERASLVSRAREMDAQADPDLSAYSDEELAQTAEKPGPAGNSASHLLSLHGRAYGAPASDVDMRRVDNINGVVYQYEFRRCNKKCKCQEGELHGPYWYAYYSDEDGVRLTHYVGLVFVPFIPQ